MAKEPKTVPQLGQFPKGVNLIGSFSQDSGLGQSCRIIAKIIERSSIPHHFIDFCLSPELVGTNQDFAQKYSDTYKYGVNLFHINMHEFQQAYNVIDKSNWNNHYNIAFWLWEMQEFPEQWIGIINQLDEIWTPAEFVSESIRKVTDKPVITVPYTVEAEYSEMYDRQYFNLPDDRFLFLMLFDSNSISERKNPYGVIKAFKKAFSTDDSVGLVIKIGHAEEKDLADIQRELKGYHVYYIREMLPKIVVNSLIHCVDVYVSLHRSEGYGLVLAEAMYMGIPTIATAYSANIEFQDKTTACLVPAKMIPVGKDIYPYQKQMLWADPDTNVAAEYMRRLYSDRDFYTAVRSCAYSYMHDKQRTEYPIEILQTRIKEIYETD